MVKHENRFSFDILCQLHSVTDKCDWKLGTIATGDIIITWKAQLLRESKNHFNFYVSLFIPSMSAIIYLHNP